MRSLLLTVTASAGLGLIFLATPPANSMTISTPTGVRQAADELGLTEAVHCRSFRHRHRFGHGWSRGCGGAAVIVGPRRSGVVVREGGRVRGGGDTTIRSTTTRTEGTTVRSRTGGQSKDGGQPKGTTGAQPSGGTTGAQPSGR
jgi:hypothetical protein